MKKINPSLKDGLLFAPLIAILILSIIAVILFLGCGTSPTSGGGGSSGGVVIGNGILYAADSANNAIYIFNNANTREGSNLTPDRTITSAYIKNPLLNSLYLDAADDVLYVISNDLNTSACAFANASTLSGYCTPEHFYYKSGWNGCLGIFARGNRVYISNNNDHIYVFDKNSDALLAMIATTEMSSPKGLYVDSNNTMYVAFYQTITSPRYDRINVFNSVDQKSGISPHDYAPDRFISSESIFQSPCCVWLDESRDILFTDGASNTKIAAFMNASTIEGHHTANSMSNTIFPPYQICQNLYKNIMYAACGGQGIKIWDDASAISGPPFRTITISGAGILGGVAIDPIQR